jgi:hypothetical protein
MRGARGPDRAGSPAAGTKDTLAREVLMAEAAKSGVEPMVFLHRRLKQLIDAGDPKSLKEAVQISVELLPYQTSKAFDHKRECGRQNAKRHSCPREVILDRRVAGNLRPHRCGAAHQGGELIPILSKSDSLGIPKSAAK